MEQKQEATAQPQPLIDLYRRLGDTVADVLADDRTPIWLYNELAILLTEVDNKVGGKITPVRDAAHARCIFPIVAVLMTDAGAQESRTVPIPALSALYQRLGDAIADVLADERTLTWLYNALIDLLANLDNAICVEQTQERNAEYARHIFPRLALFVEDDEAAD